MFVYLFVSWAPPPPPGSLSRGLRLAGSPEMGLCILIPYILFVQVSLFVKQLVHSNFSLFFSSVCIFAIHS